MKIKLTECPRDAMQGLHDFVPTELKVEYLNALLKVGFDVLDFGSFVSPKAIPQLKDTGLVIPNLIQSETKLLAIIANLRGAEAAAEFERVDILGFPFSISEQFQIRNTNASREEAFERIKEINLLCNSTGKKLRLYLSMAFGNPYNEDYNPELVLEWSKRLYEMLGIDELVLSDTTGMSDANSIKNVFNLCTETLPNVEFSAHLHSSPTNWKGKIDACFDAGCRSFDSAIKGIGGCPMANDDLVGNVATENLLANFSEYHSINMNEFQKAFDYSSKIFL